MPPASVDLTVQNLRSQKGLIRICITADPENFPGCTDDRNAITRSVKTTGAPIHIGGLPQGNFAMALIHDENGNARLDTFAGIPREGIGFSRNPAVTFGPPQFTAARFAVGAQPVAQTVKMKYFL